MVAHHQRLDVRQIVLGDQLPLRRHVHVAGDQQVIVAVGAEDSQTLLVVPCHLPRRVDGEAALPQGQDRLLPDVPDVRAVIPGGQLHLEPHPGVVGHVRQQERPHPGPGQQLRHAGDMVVVVMGQDQVVQGPAAHGGQVVRRDAAGVIPAVAAAAVHQGELPAGGQQHALPLAHVQHVGVQAAAGVVGRPQIHRRRQGHRRQHCGHGVFPPLPGPQKAGGGEQDVQKHQPVFQIRVGEVHRVVGNGGQHPGHPQDVSRQQGRGKADHRPQGQPEEAGQHRQQSQHEHGAGGRQAQEVAERRDQHQGAEVDGAQGHREHHGPHGGRQAGGQQPVHPSPGFLPHQQVLDPRRQPQQPRHGPKGQLQTDGGRGEGIGQQNQKQGGGQRGGRVAVPLEQGRRQHEHHHDAGPDHRGAGAGEKRVKHQDGQRQRRHQTTPVPAGRQQDQGHQEAAVHPGHRQDVAQPRLRQVRPGLVRQAGGVSGEDGAQKGRHVSVEQRRHLGLHGPGRPGGPPPGRTGGALAADGLVSPLVGQQEHSLGGEVGDGVLPEPGGVLELHPGRHRLSRPQVQQVLPAVVDHLAQGKAVQLHRHLGAVVRGDGVLQQGHGGGAL